MEGFRGSQANYNSLAYFNTGVTPLHEAAKQGQNYIIKVLVSENRNYLSLVDKCGLTPLHYAALFSKKDSYVLLLQLGANAEIADNFGRTPAQILQDHQEVEISGNYFPDMCTLL